MMSYISKQIEDLEKEQSELRAELDEIDCTHYTRYSKIIQKISENENKISGLQKFLKQSLKKCAKTA